MLRLKQKLLICLPAVWFYQSTNRWFKPLRLFQKKQNGLTFYWHKCFHLVVFEWIIPFRSHLTIFVHLSISSSDRLSIHSAVHLTICPSVHLSICPSVHLSICPSVHLSICTSVYFHLAPLFIHSYLSNHSLSLFVYAFVCL